MKILVTGASGFIGRNLCVWLSSLDEFTILTYDRDASDGDIEGLVAISDGVVHLAGVNRPQDEVEFTRGNAEFTERLMGALRRADHKIPVVYASTVHATLATPYGRSKLVAEGHVREYGDATGAPIAIYRLPNVFGKWCRPNYNSVVATFCYKAARGESVEIHDPAAVLRLVHVDDVVSGFTDFLRNPISGERAVHPEYVITVGDLACKIEAFAKVRENSVVGEVGVGIDRALYSTFVSYLPTNSFSYEVAKHVDDRGSFVEMLRTKTSGQFSYFTAKPGITRGGHYHHTKTEKFLVISGTALFRFRHIVTDEYHEIKVDGQRPEIVETVPGWSHDITNVGADELVVMLWANELFDRNRPDTIARKVSE